MHTIPIETDNFIDLISNNKKKFEIFKLNVPELSHDSTLHAVEALFEHDSIEQFDESIIKIKLKGFDIYFIL